MSNKNNCDHVDGHPHDHICQTPCTTSTLYQTLDELDFERGIWYAAQSGDVEKVRKLLRQGTGVDSLDSAGYTALHYASRNGHLNVCKVLLQSGANINATTNAGHATSLHRACSAGKVDIVKYLLENRADGKIKDSDGKTPLHRAVLSGNSDICAAVLQRFPEVKTEKDIKGNVPADYILSNDIQLLFN